jgi:hypothetical protein
MRLFDVRSVSSLLVRENVTVQPYDQFAIGGLFQPIGVEHWTFEFFDGGGDGGEKRYGRHPFKGMPADARYKPGSGGQLIALVPSLNLMITRQTGSSGSWEYEEYLRWACDAVIKQ